MAGTVDNARIWEGADAYVGALGSTVPTNVTDPWEAGWEALGLLSEDGAKLGREQSVKEHYAWGSILARTSKTKHKRSIKVTCLEDSAVVFGLVNPGSTAETAGEVTTRTVVIPSTDARAFGLETRDGDITRRIVIPHGEVVEVGEVTLSEEEMTGFELTINIYPDEEGVWYYELTNDPAAVEGS
jgi:hypothetical protein